MSLSACRRRRRILPGILMGILLAAAPIPAQEKPSVPRLKPISMEGNPGDGEKVYLRACWACHGLAGDGKGPASAGMSPPPTDFTAPGAFRDKPDATLLDAILKGKPGTAMFPQGLVPQSAVDVVAFLRTLPRAPGEEKGFLDALAHADKEKGRALYNSRCWPCHGPTGRGNGPAAAALRPPPADFTDPGKVADRTAARLYSVLSRGIPGTAMAAQPFTEKERFDLIAYLRSLVQYGDGGGAPREGLVPGDTRKGKELYDRRCWACHGSSGGGDGPAAADMIPAPTRFSDYEAMRGRRDPDWTLAIQSGVPGTAMYAQRLTPAEIQDLIAYLRTLGRRKAETLVP